MPVGQTISLIFASIFLVLTLIGLIKGLLRGVKRQGIRIATIIFSVIAALALTTMISTLMEELCADKNLEELLMVLGLNKIFPPEVLDILACYDATTIERLIDLPFLAIIMPFIFSGCFVFISILAYIVHGVFCLILGYSKKELPFGERCGGMVVGLLQGVIVSLIFLLPFMNLFGMASDINDELVENGETAESNAFCQVYTEYLEPTCESALFTTSYDSFVCSMCDSFATVDINGEDVNLRHTTSFLVAGVYDIFNFGSFDWSNPTEEQCASLEQMIGDISGDKYVSFILSGFLRGTAKAVDTGLFALELEEPVAGVIHSLIAIFTELDEEDFAEDVDTVLDVYLILAREDVLSSLIGGTTESISNIFTQKDSEGKTVIKRVTARIEANERMRSLISMLSNLTLSIMMDSIGIENGAEIYTTVSEGIKDIISIDKSQYATKEEYHEAVSNELAETLAEHGIDIDDSVVDGMATHFVDNYSDLDDLSDDEINDIILSYYDSYYKNLNGSIPGVTDPEGGEPEGGEPEGNEPVVDEPVVDEPVVDEPVVDEPVVDEPVVDEPVVDEPVVDEPVVDEP